MRPLARIVDEGSRTPDEKKFVRWGMSWWCRPLRGAIQRAVIFPVLRLLYGFRVVGASEIEDLEGPVLFAANHCLRLDNGLLIRAMPPRHRRRLAIAAWEELWSNFAYRITHPLLGNGFPFSKEGAVRASLENMGRILDDGWSVLIYPEGELTVGGPMRPFRGGTGLVAVESGIPVVPIKLDILKIGSPSGFPMFSRGDVEVRFGSPIMFPRGTTYEEATATIEQAVRELWSMGITVIIVLILLALAGAVTAPVVSLTCALVARARKLEVWRCALAGALFGVFTFPWPYVLVRIYGRSLHIAGLGVIYFFAYVLWLGAAATVVVQIVWIWEYTLGTSTGYVASGGNVVSAVFMSALYASGIGVCVFGLFRSLRGLHGKYNSERYPQKVCK